MAMADLHAALHERDRVGRVLPGVPGRPDGGVELMSLGMILQHAVAIAIAIGAGAWLVARTRSPKHRGEGPCASCSAAAHLRTAKRPEASPSRVVILKK